MTAHSRRPWRVWLAPAKINLFLEVLARRDDGFHEIETLMAPVAIYDTLWFTPQAEGNIELACRWAAPGRAQRGTAPLQPSDEFSPDPPGGPPWPAPWGDLPPAEKNLAYRAVSLLRERAGVKAGALMRLVKRIPSAAGLGGASSDAAYALLAANEGWNLHWPRPRLMELAAELGSDVGFFLGRGAAVCRGRGERIESADGLPPLHVVVARPPTGLSTAAVYADCRPAEKPRRLEPLLHSLRAGNIAAAGAALVNRLQAPAERLSPQAALLSRELASLDVEGRQMSGSGSSYFALCRSARHAKCVAARLRSQSRVAQFVAAAQVHT